MCLFPLTSPGPRRWTVSSWPERRSRVESNPIALHGTTETSATNLGIHNEILRGPCCERISFPVQLDRWRSGQDWYHLPCRALHLCSIQSHLRVLESAFGCLLEVKSNSIKRKAVFLHGRPHPLDGQTSPGLAGRFNYDTWKRVHGNKYIQKEELKHPLKRKSVHEKLTPSVPVLLGGITHA